MIRKKRRQNISTCISRAYIHTCLCLDKVWQDTQQPGYRGDSLSGQGLELEMVVEDM